MSAAAAAGRTGRFYTAARRHPWVLGKVADWKIPLGPYTPAQIAVAVGGGFLLIKTIGWWSWMGPFPIGVSRAARHSPNRLKKATASISAPPAPPISMYSITDTLPPPARVDACPCCHYLRADTALPNPQEVCCNYPRYAGCSRTR